jgi:monoamine oxidase
MLSKKAHNIGHLIELFAGENLALKRALLNLMSDHEGLDVYKQSIYYNFKDLKNFIAGSHPKCYDESDHSENKLITAMVESGNSRLPMTLTEKINGRLFYNKPLRKVTLKKSSAVIEFRDGSSYKYKKVIIAIPASTFEDIDFTESGIDPTRLQKIQSIEYGQNYKIVYPIKVKNTKAVDFYVNNDSCSWYNYDNTVKIIYDCSPAVDIYSHGDIKKHPLKAYDENYYTYNGIVTHNWNHDEYARGSYAGYSVVISKELDETVERKGVTYKRLFTPIKNILFFAGEHTTLSEYIGTMEAAVESGERIALSIINSCTTTNEKKDNH